VKTVRSLYEKEAWNDPRYNPRKEIIDGNWAFPQAQAAK
jgi:hypothetical protein